MGWSVRIESVELDDQNMPHLVRHGVSVDEIARVFEPASRYVIRRNKGGRAADYCAEAFGIRVNFVYAAATRTARPVSAWRI
ncbi:MAG: hypothetical protein ACRDPW_06605 [Mycobacteriales bacterium]